MNREVLTVGEVAAALGVGRGRAYQLARQGAIPTVRRGRRLWIPRAAWEEFMHRQATAALAGLKEETHCVEAVAA